MMVSLILIRGQGFVFLYTSKADSNGRSRGLQNSPMDLTWQYIFHGLFSDHNFCHRFQLSKKLQPLVIMLAQNDICLGFHTDWNKLAPDETFLDSSVCLMRHHVRCAKLPEESSQAKVIVIQTHGNRFTGNSLFAIQHKKISLYSYQSH